MQVNTNTWHFKLYDMTYLFDEPNMYHGTNLCQYMRRLFLSPFFLFMKLLTYVVVFGIGGIISLFIGYYPTFSPPRNYHRHAFEQYELPNFHGFKVFPAYGFIPIILGVLAYFALWVHNSMAIGASIGLFIGLAIIGTVHFGFQRAINRPYRQPNPNSFFNLFIGWVKVKKAQFCPTVEFVDGESKE